MGKQNGCCWERGRWRHYFRSSRSRKQGYFQRNIFEWRFFGVWSRRLGKNLDVNCPEFWGDQKINVDMGEDSQMLDFVRLFISDEFIDDVLVRETNKYAAQVGGC